MKSRIIGAIIALLTLALVAACGDDECERELAGKVLYRGGQTGTFYKRWSVPVAELHSGVDQGVVKVPLAELEPGVFQGAVISSLCFPTAKEASQGLVEAWVDLDDDDSAACAGDGFQDPSCGPDSDEPQASRMFTLDAQGTTEVSFTFTDPE